MDGVEEQNRKKRYRNWIKGGLGLKYLKNGLEDFCDEMVKQQHRNLKKTVEEKINVSDIQCSSCNVSTLQPNHVKVKGKCPLFHIKCNCLHPGGNKMCPHNVCGVMYDEIIRLHASNPPCPNWKNTNSKRWCTDPWSVAKCFINASGYEEKSSASEIDCSGLLHVFLNSKGMRSLLTFSSTGPNVFAKALQSRNFILHSAKMELSDEEVKEHIENMIDVLKECTQLNSRKEASEAIENLVQIQNQDISFSTQTEGEILQSANAAMENRMKDMEEKMVEIQNELVEIKNARVFQQEHISYLNKKQAFQQGLINLYMERVVKVSPLPLQSDRHCTDIGQLYASPWMTFSLIDENLDRDERNVSVSRDVLVKSSNDIFYKNGTKNPKRLYIRGSRLRKKCILQIYCTRLVLSTLTVQWKRSPSTRCKR
ncbi:uncharacterized protein LOC132716112 [Ruditapes philippinarum]|uniref:uncharacterized protein LOC132716112 n=1 Tax=Ruditapes philippinarum TaxID=129788 RepID=UPI00295B13D0|nr:uncharacterized protein LOC132716112 [Ruditapes philippinarum]